MEKRPKIAVLMSSYNGEKFIKEQIDSILSQKDVDVTLFIRDDGSTDKTIEIIGTYLNNNNVKLITDGRNLRPGLSFLTLLSEVVKKEQIFDYYAFSDQDDIWLEEKLIAAVKMINGYDNPTLYCSNQIIYENNMNTGVRFLREPVINLLKCVSVNEMYGCTMVFNRKLAEIVETTRYPSEYFLIKRNHDAWILLLALIKGHIIYDNNAYMFYRIHNNNVVGLNKLTIYGRLYRFMKKGVKNLRKTSCNDLLESFPHLDFKDRCHIEKMANYQNNIKDRISLLKDYRYCKCERESVWAFWTKVIINYI